MCNGNSFMILRNLYLQQQQQQSDAADIVDAVLSGLNISFQTKQQRKSVRFTKEAPTVILKGNSSAACESSVEDSPSDSWYNDSDMSRFKLMAVKTVLGARRAATQEEPARTFGDSSCFYNGSYNDITGLSKYIDASDLASAESKPVLVEKTVAIHAMKRQNQDVSHDEESSCTEINERSSKAAYKRACRTYQQVYGDTAEPAPKRRRIMGPSADKVARG